LSAALQPGWDELLGQLQAWEAHLQQVVLGKPEVVRLVLVALLAQGHVLLEDVPGVGKTLVGKALAQSLHGHFSRLQMTPDLLPSDIVGSSVLQAGTGEFVYRPGPLFAQVVLADEINRTTPRTQSALLEAMSEQQVSVDGRTHPLPRPFLVIATQNPYEYEGTFPLPESQLDRFLLRTRMGYPARADERAILHAHRQGEPVSRLPALLEPERVVQLQDLVREIRLDDSLSDYILDLVEATRQSPELHVGVSTRGALALYRAAQALALLERRDYVIPDDLQRLALPVLAHRVQAKTYSEVGARSVSETVVEKIVATVAVPE